MWFRRDLRAHDNAALYHALRSCRQVLLRLRVRPAILTRCRASTGASNSSASRWLNWTRELRDAGRPRPD